MKLIAATACPTGGGGIASHGRGLGSGPGFRQTLPLQLELQLLACRGAFVLDAKDGHRWNGDALVGNLDGKRLASFQGVGQTAQPSDELSRRADLLHVSLGFCFMLVAPRRHRTIGWPSGDADSGS